MESSMFPLKHCPHDSLRGIFYGLLFFKETWNFPCLPLIIVKNHKDSVYRYFLRTTFFQGKISFHLFLLYIVLIIGIFYGLFFSRKHNFPSLPLIHCPHKDSII